MYSRWTNRLLEELGDDNLMEIEDDPEALQRAWIDSLAVHTDPVWREIGEQLRDGVMTTRQLWLTGSYREKALQDFWAAKDELCVKIERLKEDG